MIEADMRASCTLKSTLIAALTVGALAYGQTDQSTTALPSTKPPTAPPPSKPRPLRQTVAGAAKASKNAKESAPPARIYRNRDVKDPAEADHPAAASPVAAPSPAKPAVTPTASHSAAQTAADEIQKDRAFEAQAKVFKSQILAEKEKIVGIQRHMASLQYQFDAWSAEYSQDADAPLCWTSYANSPYYKDWCDTGRDLKAQYDASQRQLDQEKTHLEQMQENIRHKGYGNAVYDPD